MFTVSIAYKFDQPFNIAHLSVPEKEEALAGYISENIYDAELIEISDRSRRVMPEYIEFINPANQSVYIEFVASINDRIIKSFTNHENAINDYIMENLNRESVYLEEHRKINSYDYFIVRLVRISGMKF